MQVQCHNCGNGDLDVLYSAPAFDAHATQVSQRYNIARCKHCALVNTALPHPVSEIPYTGEYYGSSSSKFVSLIEMVLAFATRRRASSITKLWRGRDGLQHNPSVLDIGCGRGLLLRAFQAEGSSVLGLERSEFPLDDSCTDIVRTGSLAEPEYANHRFDIVILWHVFEHVEQHEALVDEITRHLNENGMLILAVPNFGSFQQRLFGSAWFHLDLPRHLVHIDSQWLLAQLSSRGYTIERQSHLDPIQNTYGFIQSALNALAPNHQNVYYELLKHGSILRPSAWLPLFGWSLLAAFLLPLAVIECFSSSVFKRGATVQVFARRGTTNDQE